MRVKIKKLNEKAVIPEYANPTDAGLDLTCTAVVDDEQTGFTRLHTGLAIEIPEGYVGLIFPRSSIYKSGYRLSNAVGVIDSGYRGEIILMMDIHGMMSSTMGAMAALEEMGNISSDEVNNVLHNMPFNEYEVGDRVGQLIIMPYPKIEFEEVKELSETERGEGGFGSTGS